MQDSYDRTLLRGNEVVVNHYQQAGRLEASPQSVSADLAHWQL